IMRWFHWHVPAKMSLGFLCLFLVWNIGKDDGLSYLEAQQGKLFLNLFLHFTASCRRKEIRREKRAAVLATAELPAKSVDLAAVNLTEVVNGMLSMALRGTKKLFSLLSITSYSSFAFHKVSVTIYNISSLKNVEPGKFPMHYCYCLNNVTNGLTDFTALLVDIIGNSTSYLTEIFKSTSILSVRQSNDSDCIYICVMTGQTGRNLSDFWEVLEKSPVINYTFSSNTSSDLGNFMKLQEDSNKTVDPSAEHMWTFKSCWCPPSVSPASPATSIPLALKGEDIPTTRSPPLPKTPCGPAPVSSERRIDTCFTPLALGFGQKPTPNHVSEVDVRRPFREACSWSLVRLFTAARTGHLSACKDSVVISKGQEQSSVQGAVVPAVSCLGRFSEGTKSMEAARSANYSSMMSATLGKLWQKTNCFVFRAVFFLGCPQAILKESRVTLPPVTVIVQKINQCVMELCRFFQLCLCVGQRKYSRKEAMRYCVEYYSWFLKNASYICERVKRVAYSHTLKQKCLKNICKSV
ncbi:HHLA1 protein, partial [Chauna torquata]|nr:HHLA1 protein [Chauna torquata]